MSEIYSIQAEIRKQIDQEIIEDIKNNIIQWESYTTNTCTPAISTNSTNSYYIPFSPKEFYTTNSYTPTPTPVKKDNCKCNIITLNSIGCQCGVILGD